MMRIFTADIEADALLIDDIDVIIVRTNLPQTERFAAIRCLLPEADSSTVLALCDQIHEPTVRIDSLPSLM
jgi:chromosomal replication initiation ATPase DnaA